MIGEPYESRKLDSQTIETSNSPITEQMKPSGVIQIVGMHVSKIKISDDFRSSLNKVADKRASEVLTNKIHNEFSDVLSGIGCLRVHSHCWLKMIVNHIRYYEKDGTCFAGTPERGAIEATMAGNNSSTRHG